MIVRFSSDVWEDSGLDSLISNLLISRYLNGRYYGNEDVKIFFVINCIGEDTKNRKRYDKKENTLYWDVILSYKAIKNATESEKKDMLANAIISSFDVVDEYKKLNIEKIKLKEDVRNYFVDIGWISTL